MLRLWKKSMQYRIYREVSMDIEQLTRLIDNLSMDELQRFDEEAMLRLGVNQLMVKPVQEQLLASAKELINTRLTELGLKYKEKPDKVTRVTAHSVSKAVKQRTVPHSNLTVRTVSPEEMEKLWR